MSGLIQQSFSDLHTAKLVWRFRSEDDLAINRTCYSLQQSVEKSLKFLIEVHGTDYPHTHDIQKLLEKVSSLGVHAEILDKLESYAEAMTDWEARSSYADDFCALRSKVEDVMVLAQELLDYAKTFAVPDIPDGAIEWCRKYAPSLCKDYADEDLWAAMKTVYYKEHQK